MDGMGGAMSSNSKTVILDKSSRDDHDVDYTFRPSRHRQNLLLIGQVTVATTGAVGAFAVNNGLVDANKIPENGICTVKFGKPIFKTIIAHVPITNGQVRETGDFVLRRHRFSSRRSGGIF